MNRALCTFIETHRQHLPRFSGDVLCTSGTYPSMGPFLPPAPRQPALWDAKRRLLRMGCSGMGTLALFMYSGRMEYIRRLTFRDVRHHLFIDKEIANWLKNRRVPINCMEIEGGDPLPRSMLISAPYHLCPLTFFIISAPKFAGQK